MENQYSAYQLYCRGYLFRDVIRGNIYKENRKEKV